MTRSPAVCIALAAFLAPAFLAPALEAQFVRGLVVDSSGAPVPFAIVMLADSSRSVLTDSKGIFRIGDLARARYRVRVRHIGFRPAEREVEAGDSLVAVRDTLRLVRMAVMLETVTVGPTAACRQTGFASAGGEGVAELFEQLSLNAQRWVMIKAAGPDSIRYERNRSYLGPNGTLLGDKTDTISLPRMRSERYQPGAMLRQESSGHLVLIVPAIEDLADARFLGTHCFRYAAQEFVGGRSAHRIDFEPAADLTGFDVRGAVWLDVGSLLLLQVEYHVAGMDKPQRGVVTYNPVVKSTFVSGIDGAPRMATGTITQQVRKGTYQGKDVAVSIVRHRLLEKF